MPKASIYERSKDDLIEFLGAKEAIAATLREAGQSGLPGETGGPQDAYRHLLIAAELIRRNGELKGRVLLMANELKAEAKREQTPRDKKMDNHNNALAIEIGKKAKTWDDVVRLSRDKITESLRHGGDGKDGRATWYKKPEHYFKFETEKPAAPNDKGDKEHKYTGFGPNPIEGEIGGTPGNEKRSTPEDPAMPDDRSDAGDAGTGGGDSEPSAQQTGSAENSPGGQ